MQRESVDICNRAHVASGLVGQMTAKNTDGLFLGDVTITDL